MTIVYGTDEYGEEVYTVVKDGDAVGGVFLSLPRMSGEASAYVHFEYYGPNKDHFIYINEHFNGVSAILTAEQALEKAIELGWDKD